MSILKHINDFLGIPTPLLNTYNMHHGNKPLDEKVLMQAQAILWNYEDISLAEQRFFNAGSFKGSELKYTEILQMYQQAQSDANKIHNLI